MDSIPSMKKQILISTILYTLSLLIILTIYTIFLNTQTNREVLFFIILSLSFAFGYIFSTYILSSKFKIDKNLLNLTQEIIHEINIPIATIQANSKLLKRTLKNQEKGLVRLERIEASTQRLKRLYAELIYSIKKEISPIEREEFNLKELIEERVEAMKLLNRNPFLLHLVDVNISADKIGFEKMLDNILTNAMKYSNKDKPISIELNQYILTIKDQGIGMDEHQIIKIFERYYQLDNTIDGEGIGLALVQTYCNEAKIKITILSKKGEGTEVKLDLSKLRSTTPVNITPI
jgi:signal transduction histidine kinase